MPTVLAVDQVATQRSLPRDQLSTAAAIVRSNAVLQIRSRLSVLTRRLVEFAGAPKYVLQNA